MSQHDKQPSSKTEKQAGQFLRVLFLVSFVLVALMDGFFKLGISQIVYFVLAAGALGADDLKKVWPGGTK